MAPPIPPAPPPDFSWAVNAAAGFAAGLAGVVLWEWLLKPRRMRRNVARLLLAEAWLNVDRLARTEARNRKTGIAPNFRLSTLAFDKIADQVGELPDESMNHCVDLYWRIQRLNEYPVRYQARMERLRATDPSELASVKVQSAAALHSANMFSESATKLLKSALRFEAEMKKYAAPWWSSDRWRKPAPRVLDSAMYANENKRAERNIQKAIETVEQQITPSTPTELIQASNMAAADQSEPPAE